MLQALVQLFKLLDASNLEHLNRLTYSCCISRFRDSHLASNFGNPGSCLGLMKVKTDPLFYKLGLLHHVFPHFILTVSSYDPDFGRRS